MGVKEEEEEEEETTIGPAPYGEAMASKSLSSFLAPPAAAALAMAWLALKEWTALVTLLSVTAEVAL